MDPESNHTSISSGVRFMLPLHESQTNVTSSTNGLWRSSGSGTFFPRFSSSMLPTQRWGPHFSQIHIRNGSPQNLSLESPQSLFSSSQLQKRLSPTPRGIQLMVLFNSIILWA